MPLLLNKYYRCIVFWEGFSNLRSNLVHTKLLLIIVFAWYQGLCENCYFSFTESTWVSFKHRDQLFLSYLCLISKVCFVYALVWTRLSLCRQFNAPLFIVMRQTLLSMGNVVFTEHFPEKQKSRVGISVK